MNERQNTVKKYVNIYMLQGIVQLRELHYSLKIFQGIVQLDVTF